MIRQSGGLPWLLLAVWSLWLAGEAVEAGLLEKVNTAVNSVGKKTDTPQLDPLPCIHTDRSGMSYVICRTSHSISLLRIFQLSHIVLHSYQSVQCVRACVRACVRVCVCASFA